MGRTPCCDKANVKRGPWSPEEDDNLRRYMEKHGNGANWIGLPSKAGLKRCGKSCRLRWLNYLRPDINRGSFSEEEDRFICTLYSSIGSRWSFIASKLAGRTDNDVKNHWNTKLKKKLREANSFSKSNPQSTSSNMISTNLEPHTLPYGNSPFANTSYNDFQQNVVEYTPNFYSSPPQPLPNPVEISGFRTQNGSDLGNSTSQEASSLSNSNYSSSMSWSSNGNFAEKQGFEDADFDSVYDIINGFGFQDESSLVGSSLPDLPFL